MVLPEKTPKGEHVLLQTFYNTDASKFNYCGFAKKVDMMISLYNHFLGMSPGQQVIVDAANYTMGHLSKIDMTVLKKYALFLQVSFETS